MRVLVLGYGMQGRAVVHDLVAAPEVTSVVCADADLDRATAELADLGIPKTIAKPLDAADPAALATLLTEGYDVVVDTLPRHFVRAVAESAIAAGVHLVNTNYDDNLRDLDDRARAAGVAVLPEMGLDPGIDLMMAAEAVRRFDSVTHLLSYGSGIPAPGDDDNPLRYRISWTWEGVLDSYTRPARIVRRGEVVEVPGSNVFDAEQGHTVEIVPFGILEAAPNGDAAKYAARFGIAGSAVEVGRYTLRYPGHGATWQKLAALGFLETEPVSHLGAVTPRRFMVEHLGPRLQYGADQRDAVILRVEARGIGGPAEGWVLQLVDFRDPSTGLFAMNRTVGFAASIAAQMIVSGEIAHRGVLSPITDVPWTPFVTELAARGITITESSADGRNPLAGDSALR
jgi:saccharopine dehydrogenase-like NADP-dependent oxidoreductase